MTNLQSDLICFSHLRWTFVFQRPQHLMSRFARHQRVYFFEEPVFEGATAELKQSKCPHSGVRVITPCIPDSTDREQLPAIQRTLLRELIAKEQIENFVAWYYTPMALDFTEGLHPVLSIYDCMDELSAFANAPAGMIRNEQRLFKQCDLVFTGGASLFEAKRKKHERVHLFPSSVDVAHFSTAQSIDTETEDQQAIPHPRIGYVGVIDERMDAELIRYLADKRPDWQIILIGPVVKIAADSLPQRPNIHYLGMKDYRDLPKYLAGWDVALLPFAQNDATRYISPTKTPEYLAAGLPVVSTPIRDVVKPYGERGLVFIGKDRDEFLQGVEQQLSAGRPPVWRSEVAAFLKTQSWDKSWMSMQQLMLREVSRKKRLVSEHKESSDAALFTPQVSAAHV